MLRANKYTEEVLHIKFMSLLVNLWMMASINLLFWNLMWATLMFNFTSEILSLSFHDAWEACGAI